MNVWFGGTEAGAAIADVLTIGLLFVLFVCKCILPGGYDQYDYDSEQTDKINASYERTLKRSEGKITDEEKWFEIDGSSYEGMPLPNSGEYTKEYRLNTSGLVSSYTDPDGASQTFTYNADGTLARLEYRNPSYPDARN